MKRLSNQKGFTLIELMIVITVIAILSAVALFAFTRVQKQSRDARRKAEMKTLQTALVAYNADNGTYPATIGLLCPTGPSGCTGAAGSVAYVNSIPTAPSGGPAPVAYTYTAGAVPIGTFALTVGLEVPVVAATPVWCIGGTQSQGMESTVAACTPN